MKKMAKKFLVLTLSSMMCISSASTVLALEATDYTKLSNDYMYSYSKTHEEVERELKEQINSQVSEIQKQYSLNRAGESVDPANWKTEYGPKKTVTLGGYAGGQVQNGYQFPTGGGFYFSDSGGPSVSVSVNYDIPYTPVSVSVGLGNSSTSGKFVSVPNKTDYFKLYVSKEVEVQPYITYTRDSRNSPWKVYYRGKVQSVLSVSAYAKKV